MHDEKNTGSKSSSSLNAASDSESKPPNDLFIGSVTFVVFIIFMTVWMYFGTTG